MKHRLSWIGLCACALCLAFGLLGCTQSEPYQPKALTPVVNTPVIGEEGTLRVGVNTDEGAPFIVSSDSASDGLNIDIAAAIADEMGLKLKIVNIGTDAQSALETGEVDIVLNLTSSDASKTVWVSDPYLQTGVALFAGSGNTAVPTRGSSPKISAQSSSTSAWAVENAFGDDAIVPASDLMSAFSNIETGKAAYVAADAVIGSYAALYQNVDVVPIAVLGSVSGYCAGVSASNAELQTALATAISALSEKGIFGVISAKWLGGSLDLSALSVIETSTPASDPSATTAGADGEGSDAEGGASASAVNADGSTAGSNAVLPSSTSSAA